MAARSEPGYERRPGLLPGRCTLSNMLLGYRYGGPFLLSLPYGFRGTFVETSDPVRYGAIQLALKRIEESEVTGGMAEAGVYKGETSSFIHSLCPSRKLYLFDTFSGFDRNDLKGKTDGRFKDTCMDEVKVRLGDLSNVEFRPGYFPHTAAGLEDEKFAFVMLDFDLYEPTLAGLRFFYDRVSPGGYIFVHDYNSPESDWGVSRAVDEFMLDKPEMAVEIPDKFGSVIIRKG